MSSSTTVSNPVPPPQPPSLPPVSAAAAAAAAAAQTSSQAVIKNEILKPIGICLSSNAPIEIANTTANNNNFTNQTSTGQTSSSLNISYSNATKNIVNNNANNFYTTTTQGLINQAGSVSLMVTKLTPAPRQQTVILQPRINTTRGTTIQLQNSNRSNASGNVIPNSQTMTTSFPSSNSSSISVRTRLISNQGNHTSTIPFVNLSTMATTNVTSCTTNSMKQMLTGQKIIGGLETVNLMISNPNEVRNIKTGVQNNEIKSSVYKINNPKQLTGSTATAALVASHTPKMISINNASGHQSCATTTARLGILSSNNNAKSVFNLAAKNFILTPGASGITNMVSITPANFTANRIPLSRQHTITTFSSTTQPSTNLQSTATSTTTVTGKPTPTTIYTVNTANQTTANVLNNNPNIITTIQPIMTNAHQQTNSHQTSTLSTSNASSIVIANNTATKQAMNIQTINSISPIKTTTNLSFPIHQQSQTSPRPRILSRKRTLNETSAITVKPANLNATNGSLAFVTANTLSSTVTNQQQIPIITNDKSVISVNILDSNKIETSNNNINNNINNCIEINNNTTPRKKPRKQLLEPSPSSTVSPSSSSSSYKNKLIISSNNQLLCNNNSNNDNVQQQINNNHDCNEQVSMKEIVFHNNNDHHHDDQPQEQPKLTHLKKPRLSIINYHSNGKLPQFTSYSDVKPKNDKKLTLQDVMNEVLKKNEWKDLILVDQCKKLAEDEDSSMYKQLELFLLTLENEISPFSKCAERTTLYDEYIENRQSSKQKINCIDRKCVRVNDLLRANIQRSKVISDNFNECHETISKLVSDHQTKASKLIERLNNKRNSTYSK